MNRIGFFEFTQETRDVAKPPKLNLLTFTPTYYLGNETPVFGFNMFFFLGFTTLNYYSKLL